MGRIDFHRDSASIEAILKTHCVELVKHAADKVAKAAEGEIAVVPGGADFPIQVDAYTTDRAAAAVMIAHPAGENVENKYHVLKRAAGGVGLEVKAAKRRG